MKNQNKDYTIVAEIYNHLMRKIDYKDWAEYLFDIIKEYHEGELNALELASGTGTLGVEFSKYAENIIFTDLSKNMLLHTNDNFYRVCSDMTRLPFKKKFNTIFSTFDSLNYLLESEQLVKCFNEVEKILTNDGIFTFDISLELNSKKFLKHLNRKGKFKEFSYIQKSNYDEQNKIHSNNFLIKKDDFVFEEDHKQRIYSVEEILEISEKSDLRLLDVFEAFTLRDLTEKSLRAQFVLGKKNAEF